MTAIVGGPTITISDDDLRRIAGFKTPGGGIVSPDASWICAELSLHIGGIIDA